MTLQPWLIGAMAQFEGDWIPKSWTGVIALGILAGCVVAWFATREARKRIAAANKETVEAYKEAVAAVSRQLEAVTAERDDYRNKLHDERDAHNLTTIQYEKLKLQPDVAKLFDAEATWHDERRTFYKEMAETMKSMRDSIHTHDQAVEKKVEPIMEALAELLKFSKTATAALQEILDRCALKKTRAKAIA